MSITTFLNRFLGKIEDKGQKLDYQQYRLGFRAIARNTDIRTLIVGAIPFNFFCGNSILVLSKSNISNLERIIAQAIFNSFALDFYARQMLTANVNMFYIYQLPVPRLQKGDKWFDEIVERAAKLICTTPEFDDLWYEVFPHPLTPSPKEREGGQEKNLTFSSPAPLACSGRGAGGLGVTNEVQRAKLRAELDGIIAHLYQLTETEFAHILTTFPIVADPTKQAALNAYRDVRTGLIK